MKSVIGCALATLIFASGAAQAQSEITVWSWGSAAPGLEATIPGFNAEHPDITVKVEKLGYSDVKSRVLAACAAGGVGLPDVFQFQNIEMELITAQFPECAADLVPLGFDAGAQSAFPEFKLFALRDEDRMLGMPWDSGPVVMFYRRDFYDKAGVDADSLTTWDDFMTAGAAIQAANPGVTMINDNLNGGTENFRMIAEEQNCGYFTNDGQAISVAEPGCVAALETVKTMVDDKLVAAADFNQKITNVTANAVATLMNGAWMEGVIRNGAPADQSGKWGVAIMPSITADGAHASNFGGSLLAIANNSDKKAAAYTFLSYALGTKAGQITMLKDQGLVPSLTSALEDPYVDEPSAFWGGQKIWKLILGRLPLISPINGSEFFSDADQVMLSVQTAYLNGQYTSAQEAMDDAAKQIGFATGLPIAQ
ncbi:ABC transporter substrate-binding protein [Devosia rhodophyticola]|uniref:ABC transporter substrate-binding protein n=1 Tax=Devosia rhodophyticola TaxID=3026423 RepID=A0ABY7YY41_9HYPH|nr:ABC transporter substrate-binding protein [Devosia rhodophyticola]WDR06142.1 ABC transporter substrate-binding protein [Devosia rhodophyticola]